MDFEIAPLDRLNRITGVIMIIMVLAILSVPVWYRYVLPEEMTTLVEVSMWAPGVIMIIILVGAFGFSPAGYTLTEAELIVKRRFFGHKSYRLENYSRIEEGGKLFKTSRKMQGASGFFGYFGSFRNMEWKKFDAQATDKNIGLVLLGSRPLYISPRDPKFFTEMAKANLDKISRER